MFIRGGSPDGRWAVVIRPRSPTGIGTTSLAFLSLRGNASPEKLWPKGLRDEADVLAVPGARVINAASTFPAADPDVYLVWRGSIDSNVYRLRLTQ